MHAHRRRGLTAVEVVVLINALLLAAVLALQAVDRARTAAAKTKFQDNLRQVGQGLQVYHQTFRSFPAGGR
ncbi:MAG: DUF1559 domain-containing protein [Planctomycetes bacterium]|nr:DUF1559 domain-containing protein [Planctomycetota bacterium]